MILPAMIHSALLEALQSHPILQPPLPLLDLKVSAEHVCFVQYTLEPSLMM